MFHQVAERSVTQRRVAAGHGGEKDKRVCLCSSVGLERYPGTVETAVRIRPEAPKSIRNIEFVCATFEWLYATFSVMRNIPGC
jgi:hypothetical protein